MLAWLVDFAHVSAVGDSENSPHSNRPRHSPWLSYYCALAKEPPPQRAVQARLKPCWEVLFDVRHVAIAVRYLSGGLVEVGEQRAGLHHVIFRLHEQLGDCDGIVQGRGEFEAHEGDWGRDQCMMAKRKL